MKNKSILIISFLISCFFMQALSASSNTCTTLTSIKTATKFENGHGDVYVDEKGIIRFPSTLPDQLKSVIDDEKTMSDLCNLHKFPVACKKAPLGPYIEFIGLKNTLRLSGKKEIYMLEEDRAQVHFWSSMYTKKYCGN